MTEQVDAIKVGQRIRSIRLSLGLTTDELGNLLKPAASKGTISKWENGHYIPNGPRTVQIADLGEMTVDELLYGNRNEFVSSQIEYQIKRLVPSDSYQRGVIEGLKRAKALLEKEN